MATKAACVHLFLDLNPQRSREVLQVSMVDMYTVHVYNEWVIKSFADSATEDIYNGTNSKAARRIDRRVWPIAVRKLDFLNAAASLNDLKSPGNQIEKLRDDLAGYWSIRVNDQYRIIFRFVDGNALDVSCRDIIDS